MVENNPKKFWNFPKKLLGGGLRSSESFPNDIDEPSVEKKFCCSPKNYSIHEIKKNCKI